MANLDLAPLLVFEAEPEMVTRAVHHLLLRHNTELKQIYRFYAAHRCAATEAFVMTLSQFWQFARDTGLCTTASPLANLNRVLLYGAKAGTQAAPQLGIELPELQAILGGDPSAAPRLTAEGVPADPHFSERPLLLREFIQGLVALAAAGYAKQPSLPQKLRQLLTEDVLPKACPKPADESLAAAGADPGAR